MIASQFTEHLWNMALALEEANEAYKKGEVPVGAVLINAEGKLISQSHNEKEKAFDPCGHAEIIALRKAAKETKSWRLTGHTLYVTLEPCPMCLAAIMQARLSRVIFGAYDAKGGALSLNYNLHQDPRLNHQFSICGGIKHFECSRILSDFFRERRKGHHMEMLGQRS